MSKSEWGNAVWLLFHTIGSKIDETYLLENKRDLNNFITNVCTHLPCPYCASHALEILKNARLENIRGKGDLEYFFWSFHNIVNKKLNKSEFTFDELKLYKRAVTYNVFVNFRQKFSNRPYNDKLLMQSFAFNTAKEEIFKYLDDLLQNNNIRL